MVSEKEKSMAAYPGQGGEGECELHLSGKVPLPLLRTKRKCQPQEKIMESRRGVRRGKSDVILSKEGAIREGNRLSRV